MNRNNGIAAKPARPVSKQSGLTLISWLLVIILAGILALAAFRIVPAYIECARIGSALESLKEPAKTESINSLRTKLSGQLTINSLRGVELKEFKFEMKDGKLTISIDKAIRTPFIGSLGFVIQCKHSITVPRDRAY
ncbi:MAG: DUF4845 domain-containing protein [Gammaproteobacteria bacterium]|nr:DUF4845 domain-containing protein [Gammaproteobacteria bacterium]